MSSNRPANILAALSESPIVEMNWSGKQARSCGGCGGVPFTYPEISEKASRVRVEEAQKTKAGILASADPECEAMLSRVAQEIEVKDIVELVAEAFKEEGAKDSRIQGAERKEKNKIPA